MVLSLLWTVSTKDTLRMLPREAPLLFIPIIFFFNKELTKKSIGKVLENYSLGLCLVAVFLIARAIYRYKNTGNINVFFYHELATNDINAIYLSALVSVAAFYFLAKKSKTFWGYVTLAFLIGFLFLLSSKIIILTIMIIIGVYLLFFSKLTKRGRYTATALFLLISFSVGYFTKINNVIANEFVYNKTSTPLSDYGVQVINMNEAWNTDTFNKNQNFTGASFRLYQARIFTEMLEDDNIFFTGYGMNASSDKIEEKGIEHNLTHADESGVPYNQLNFHNQYIQTFAELGVIGFLLLVIMLIISFVNALKRKDFVHIAFSVLMISLFLTESFLWRQRGVVFFAIFYCLFNTGLPSGIVTDKKTL
ncbi:hypothetical protein GCM10007424_16970 [Flavobacterium suaedae]|uniref:O-antigen ligase-related domain-containing protein n=2 Tax=Flavobacterium suaedae TaxID=1767027 RepID=A0ABQ1JTZ4_9FLAO|nr:hypothetical protein GCM10007424_16970 [Flavobacterium suaedae]